MKAKTVPTVGDYLRNVTGGYNTHSDVEHSLLNMGWTAVGKQLLRFNWRFNSNYDIFDPKSDGNRLHCLNC